jgi:hypothetical protein
MSITEKLASHGHGAVEGEEYHFPEYTKGCWGKPGHKLCWLCKVRYPVRLAKTVVRVQRSHKG